YYEEQSRELGEGKKWKGARKICEEVSNEHYAQTGVRIKLNYVTLILLRPSESELRRSFTRRLDLEIS
ncbi:hypothetical protein FB446DRAFT_656226, partial [Lentinula raphanica]